MNRPEQAPEPTMDEILASIRRIIADDEQGGADQRAEAPASPEAQVDNTDDLMKDIEDALGGGEPEAKASAAPAGDDEIFDLTDEVNATGEAAGDELVGSDVLADFEALSREFAAHDDAPLALDQTDASMDEETDGDVGAQPEARAEPTHASLDRGAIPDDFDLEESAIEEAHVADMDAFASDDKTSDDVVFNATGGDEIDLPPLAVAPMPASEPALGGSSFEEGIKEMLRPLLRSWLDDNLPRLVKGALEAEARSLKPPKDPAHD